jgi:hypothetical protein
MTGSSFPEGLVEAVARGLASWGVDDDDCADLTQHMLSAAFSWRDEKPCPENCVGGLVRAFEDSDLPSRMGSGGSTIPCPADCSNGRVEGDRRVILGRPMPFSLPPVFVEVTSGGSSSKVPDGPRRADAPPEVRTMTQREQGPFTV